MNRLPFLCFLMFFVTFVFSQIPLPTDRKVYFLHGKGEVDYHWESVSNLFEAEREMNANQKNYSSGLGISVAIDNAAGDVSTSFIGNTSIQKPIAVGHSMGGNVAKGINKQYNDVFGGIVTIGTPNQGTYLPINIQNGSAAEAINDGYKCLLAGPKATISPLISVLGLTVGGKSVFGLPRALDLLVLSTSFQGIDVSVSPFFPFFLPGVIPLIDFTAVFGPPISTSLQSLLESSAIDQSTLDQTTGSNALFEINSYASQSNVPIISIWGNETSPVHWRLLSSLRNNEDPVVNDNDDESIVQIAEDVEEYYKIAKIAMGVVGIVSTIGAVAAFPHFSSVIFLGAAVYSFNAAHHWNRGVKWLNESESIWIDLNRCGTTVLQLQTINYTNDFCNCGAYMTGTTPWVNCITGCCGGYIENCTESGSYVGLVPFFYSAESDGFICGTSQIMAGIPSNNIYEAIGSNHITETNTGDPVEGELRKVWDRPNDIFKIILR